MKRTSSHFFIVCEGLSNDDVGVAMGAPCFRRYGRGLLSKPTILLKESWGGYRGTTRAWELLTLLTVPQ